MRVKIPLSLLTMAFAAVAFALASVPGTSSAQESTWDRLKRTKTLTTGCIVQLPYWNKDRKTGEWKGWAIEAAKQMASDMAPIGVKKYECGMTTWGTASLMIQSGKIDLLYAMQATPIRATAITFAGPLYNHGFMTVNNMNFKSKTRTWEDYNDPKVRIACQAGANPCLVRRFVAPRATAIELPRQHDVNMAVIAGRADAEIVTVINGVVAKQKNPGMGQFIIPQPLFSFPAYIGVANEPDKRFRDFAHWWAEWHRLRGQVEKWIKDALIASGIPEDSLPEKLYF